MSQWTCHRDLFPHQPDRTRLNRHRRALIATLTALRCRVLHALTPAHDRQCVVDSLPVPVMGVHLVPGGRMGGDAQEADALWRQTAPAGHFGRGDPRVGACACLGPRGHPRPRTAWWTRRSGGAGGQGVPQRAACRSPAGRTRLVSAHAATPPRRHAAMPVRRNRMGASRYGTGCGILPRGRPWKR